MKLSTEVSVDRYKTVVIYTYLIKYGLSYTTTPKHINLSVIYIRVCYSSIVVNVNELHKASGEQ